MYKNRVYTAEQDVVMLYGHIDIGASGAVSNVAGGNIKAAVKQVADGQYEIELSERYERLLSANFQVVAASASGVSHIEVLETPSALQSDFKADSKIKIQCYDNADTAVNPAASSRIMLRFDVRRSSVGPFDE
jgi:putative intracellular protease/amidase